MFKLGDEVDVLDEAISGEIVDIDGNYAKIRTTDGFDLEFSLSELVKKQRDGLVESRLFSKTSFTEAVSQKETKKKKSIKTKAKERFQPTMEVDLHIHQLVNSYKGMTKHEILTYQLNTAKRKLEFAMLKRIQKVVFIHGVGEGVLKLELEYLFKRYDNLKFYDANYQKYGLGATEVYIYQSK